MNVGEKIKLLRTVKGLTQKDVADSLNIAPSTLQTYEYGKREPKPITLEAISKKLGVRPYFFKTNNYDDLMIDLLNRYEYNEAISILNKTLQSDELIGVDIEENPFQTTKSGRKYRCRSNPYNLVSASESLHDLLDRVLNEVNQEGFAEIINALYRIERNPQYMRSEEFGNSLSNVDPDPLDQYDDSKDE